MQKDQKPINNYDLTAVRKEYMFRPPKFISDYFETMIEDKRDMIMVYLTFNITVMVLPAALAMYFLTTIPTWLGVIYLVAVYGLFIQRFALMLHYSEHRPLFRNSRWSYYIPYILTPFFGIPSGLYFAHHVIMHHQENNHGGWDISSTEPYQRNHFSSFLAYWARWICAVWVQLPYYLFKRKAWGLLSHLLNLMASWAAIVLVLYKINPNATFWVFVMPVMITQFLFSFGNYSQHIFVDPARPEDNYGLTYQCINVADNQYSFNDGYHITHHLNARLHWTQMPQRFLDNFDKYKNADALIFQGIQFFDIGVLVFTRQWKKLCSHVVQISDKKRTDEELIEMFKYRCTPIFRNNLNLSDDAKEAAIVKEVEEHITGKHRD